MNRPVISIVIRGLKRFCTPIRIIAITCTFAAYIGKASTQATAGMPIPVDFVGGQVLDATTRRPLRGILVERRRVANRRHANTVIERAITNPRGEFQFSVAGDAGLGRYGLTFSRAGYRPQALSWREIVRRQIPDACGCSLEPVMLRAVTDSLGSRSRAMATTDSS